MVGLLGALVSCACRFLSSALRLLDLVGVASVVGLRVVGAFRARHMVSALFVSVMLTALVSSYGCVVVGAGVVGVLLTVVCPVVRLVVLRTLVVRVRLSVWCRVVCGLIGADSSGCSVSISVVISTVVVSMTKVGATGCF